MAFGEVRLAGRETGRKTPEKSGVSFHPWHLARDVHESALAELEISIMAAFESFGRWQSACLSAVTEFSATGPENALLHMIRMDDRPKNIHDLAAIGNRTDIANIQYSLRKLIKAGLVTRSGSGRSGVLYDMTELGRKVTDDYADVRQDELIQAYVADPALEDDVRKARDTLMKVSEIYERAARAADARRLGVTRRP